MQAVHLQGLALRALKIPHAAVAGDFSRGEKRTSLPISKSESSQNNISETTREDMGMLDQNIPI